MKLSDIKGEDAIDVLADLLDPISEIASDTEVKDAFEESRLKGITVALKSHKRTVIKILAILNQKSVEEYLEGVTLATLPKEAYDLVTDEELQELFT